MNIVEQVREHKDLEMASNFCRFIRLADLSESQKFPQISPNFSDLSVYSSWTFPAELSAIGDGSGCRPSIRGVGEWDGGGIVTVATIIYSVLYFYVQTLKVPFTLFTKVSTLRLRVSKVSIYIEYKGGLGSEGSGKVIPSTDTVATITILMVAIPTGLKLPQSAGMLDVVIDPSPAVLTSASWNA